MKKKKQEPREISHKAEEELAQIRAVLTSFLAMNEGESAVGGVRSLLEICVMQKATINRLEDALTDIISRLPSETLIEIFKTRFGEKGILSRHPVHPAPTVAEIEQWIKLLPKERRKVR
jgi:hypothetical protein